jgi:transcription initiation factor TFIIIB Brf1 subunit/transcription initiation factor TFIIB
MHENEVYMATGCCPCGSRDIVLNDENGNTVCKTCGALLVEDKKEPHTT